MKNNYWKILKDYPPSHVNNSREIIREKLEQRDRAIEKFKKTPSMYWAKRLEEYGIDVDFETYDSVFVTASDFNN
jgi:hypothetical protein